MDLCYVECCLGPCKSEASYTRLLDRKLQRSGLCKTEMAASIDLSHFTEAVHVVGITGLN